MMLSKYRIYPEDEINFITDIREMRFNGIWWSHMGQPTIDLIATEEDILFLKLKHSFTYNWLEDVKFEL